MLTILKTWRLQKIIYLLKQIQRDAPDLGKYSLLEIIQAIRKTTATKMSSCNHLELDSDHDFHPSTLDVRSSTFISFETPIIPRRKP